jgi:hypothetical protein
MHPRRHALNKRIRYLCARFPNWFANEYDPFNPESAFEINDVDFAVVSSDDDKASE